MKRYRLAWLGCFLAGVLGVTAADSFPVTIKIDAAKSIGELKPIWRFFGADEPNYAYMKDGKKLLSELGQLGGPQVYFRAHHLLTSGDGAYSLKFGSTSAYKEDANGKPVYDWTINDRIFDTYLERGVKPYVEIGFMPEALSTHPQNYPHHPPVDKMAPVNGGQSYPPKDYAKWGELVYQWTKHCVEKYGADEVSQWYWEVWNEANISYWHGSPEDFRKLHDYAIAGVRRALPTARVGGPDTAGHGGPFMRAFIEHCLRGTNYATGKIGTPIDFISFHAKGSPKFVDDHVRMGIAAQLKTIDEGFRMIASYPELKDAPIVIGESDPEGCAACQGPQLGYRNGTMYSSYTAAVFARKLDLAAKYGVDLEGALTWAFEFEDQPYFAGFRSLASNGLDKPVLNVFRMFSRMSGQRLAVESDGAAGLSEMISNGVRGNPDVSAVASRIGNKLTAMLWHYHDDDLPGPTASIHLRISGLQGSDGSAQLRHFRIDETHSNAFAAWKRMGSPQNPMPDQYKVLEQAGQLQELEPVRDVSVKEGSVEIDFDFPRQAVSLLELGLP